MACEVRLAISCSPYATILYFKLSLSPSVCRPYVDFRYSILTSYVEILYESIYLMLV